MAVISVPRLVDGHVEVDLTVSGILFDMDGTLMMSTPSVEAAWTAYGEKHGIDPRQILRQSHGRRSIETLKMYTDGKATNEDARAFEKTISFDFAHLSTPVEGVREFVNSLPTTQWGVVTSATNVMADEWLKILKLNKAGVLITADEVTKGKPDPSGYLLGKKTLNLTDDFLVFEDAEAGIKAGTAAGAIVVGMATTYDAEKVRRFGADLVIPDMRSVKLKSWDEKTKTLVLTVTDPR